ncbi:Ig-like domain-containing protein [Proteiniphilum sp. UBA5259]|nr:Ig-like domain-containing protein [Proteiniphilum sp. UBA5259]
MKHNLKTIFFLFPLFCFLLTGCEENLRTEVKGAFFVNKSSLALFVGDEVQLIASPTDGTYVYRWSSDDASVATVDKDGLVKAVGAGVTYIIVKAGDLENRVEVTSVVKVPLESVELSESHLELLYGD